MHSILELATIFNLVQIPHKKDNDFWKISHGEVLVTVMIGEGILKLKDKEHPIHENDNILLDENDEFKFIPKDHETKLFRLINL